ncbi:MAG: DNA modification methylase, partial [Myxococcota bacterium]
MIHPNDVALVRALAPATEVAPGSAVVHTDALGWLGSVPECSVHAVVTDPPYGVLEFEAADHDKLRAGRGGVWRIPPTLDGVRRRPVPRFTVLKPAELDRLRAFFKRFADEVHRVLVPGGHLFLASNPLLSTVTFGAILESSLEKRGEVIRLVSTLRGGDRPKGAHKEFPGVTVMPRSAWEPWGLFRRPLDGTVAATLRRWGTGGLRRTAEDLPFRDVLTSAPTNKRERALANHPSLKPQSFLRPLVRASLPLGRGVVLDPFCGSGSTVAAAAANDYAAIGLERDAEYHRLAIQAFPKLRDY